MAATELIRRKLSELPHKPGVYLMKDRFGTVIYVGKARDLRRRVSQYFHPSRRQGWDLKFNALVEAIHDLDTHVVRNDAEAVLLEGKLIKEFRPRFNVSFRDDKRFLLVKVNLQDPIPRFTLTRLRTDDGARYFGPFASSGALRRTLTLVRRQFNLRGCRALTPTETDYKHCLYGHLQHCTAPCIANVTREQYAQQVLAACDFLDGQCQEMESQIEAEMKKAAAAQQYEQAAQLRDLLADLRRTTQRTEKFERIPYKLPLAVNPEADVRELARVLGLAQAPARIEGFDISNISGTFAVASMVSFWHGRPDRAHYRRFKMKTVTGQDDFACIAETVRRRYTRLLGEVRAGRPNVDERTADGGGESSPAELQRAADDVSAAYRGRRPKPLTDAAASGTGFPPVAEASNPSVVHGQDALADRLEACPTTLARFETPVADGENVEGAEEGNENVQRSTFNVQPSSDESSAPWVPKPPAQPKLPDLILIDGGKGQLNAACAELAKLGLGDIPILGLAKEFEEIYRPGQSEPLRLSHESGALKLLQRVRDESHRFANTYNAQLRLKRISESVLDEFPGMGEHRKAALLKVFGSVQRLRLATIEQIATVPGFGGKAAAELKTFLEARSVATPQA